MENINIISIDLNKLRSLLRRPLVSLLGFFLLVCLLPAAGIAQQVFPNFTNVDLYAGAANDVTVTMPTASEVGDVVIVYIVQDDDDAAIIAPAEFTELFNIFHDFNGPRSGLFYRVIDGTEAPNYIFDLNPEPAVVAVLRYKNLDPITPFLVQTSVTGDSNAPTAASITTSRNNVTYLQFIGIDGASTGVLSPLSPTATILIGEEAGGFQGAEMLIASELQAIAGATPMGAFTFGGATDEWTAITLGLNAYYVNITSPADGGCLMGSTTLNAEYQVGSSSGNFELVDPLGMVIATESYATASGTVSFNFTPTLTGKYTVRDQSLSTINDDLTVYIDTDNDTVCDLLDMDDDNDGIPDNIESPNCFLSVNDVPYESGDRTNLITVSTEWTVQNGTLSNILNGDTAGNAVRKSNGDFTFNDQEFLNFTLPNAVTFDQITIYHEGEIFLDEALVGVVQGSNDGANWTDLTTPGNTVLPDAVSPHTITLTQNLADYSYYRIFVNTGRIDDDEYLREVEFSMVFDPLNYPLANCPDDTDGDLVSNHLDLDSDGDGCSDALEAGATSDITADFQFPSNASGANGLPDAVESPAESGVLNYTPTYHPEATESGITACLDRDGDSVLDGSDQDTDNDGITDIEEDDYCNVDYNLLVNKAQIQISSNTGLSLSGNIEDLLDGNTANNSFFYTNTDWTGDEIVRLQFPRPTVLSGIEFWITNNTMIDLNTVMRIQGSQDGSLWEEMSPVAEFVKTAPNNTPGVLSAAPFAHTFLWENTTSYQFYRLLGISGGGNSQPYVNELFFRTEVPSICDFDRDGLPNSADLDSDGDGIPDNVEAQSTAGYVTPNADTQGTYAGNGGVNSAYLGGLPLPDTDTDGTPDFLDTDSDNDLLIDSEESGLSVTGVTSPNGMDEGVQTSADYSDVNGVVNNPDTDLAKVTTTTMEVDYRDKKPPTIVKVCYNSDPYSLSGARKAFQDDKLLNLNNWGPDGIDPRYQFELFSFGTGPITEAALVANGCQIFYAGGNNGDAGSFDPNREGVFSASDKMALRNWSESPNNVIITFQGYAAFMGGADFAGDNNNSNPNELTPLGEVVISGVFGVTNSFNQGGGFQGRFTAFPSTACVVTQDNNGDPTGLLDGVRGDFYFADYDLLSDFSDLSSNDGISTNTDIFFANLFSSAAKVAIEGPTNVCNAFLCPAGEDPPVLATTDVSSAGLPVDLTPIYTGTPPAGTMLTWHTDSPPADDNYIGNATSYTQSGVVHAAFRAVDGGCYSPATPVIVTINYPDLEVTIAPETEISAEAETQSFTVTVTNNGPITAPDAEVKVSIPSGRQLVLANPSLGAYNGSTQLWEIGALASGQSATLDIIIRLQ